MKISELDQSNKYKPLLDPRVEQNSPQGASFADALGELISDVNSMQVESAGLTESLIKGEPVDIHDVMISAEKAKTSFQLLMELRNKGLELYREVLRLPI
ncbi:MAG: flagellar hook-basal body complex protein FliE [Chloroflexota bacterium]